MKLCTTIRLSFWMKDIVEAASSCNLMMKKMTTRS